MRKYIVDVKSDKEMYGVIIIMDDENNPVLEKSLCTCKYSSFYRFTKKNNGKICKHMEFVIDLIKRNKLAPGVTLKPVLI